MDNIFSYNPNPKRRRRGKEPEDQTTNLGAFREDYDAEDAAEHDDIWADQALFAIDAPQLPNFPNYAPEANGGLQWLDPINGRKRKTGAHCCVGDN